MVSHRGDKVCVPGIRSNEKRVPGAFPGEPRKGRDTKSKDLDLTPAKLMGFA